MKFRVVVQTRTTVFETIIEADKQITWHVRDK